MPIEEDSAPTLSSTESQHFKSEYAIEFRDVTLSYDQNRRTKPALNKVSFKIKRGERVAICGRTGSGKSSILNTLFRLYTPTSGQIWVDGASADSLSITQIRQKMSIIPQFGFLFEASLKDNLDPNSLYSSGFIDAQIKDSGLTLRPAQKEE